MADGRIVFEIAGNNANAKKSINDVVATAQQAGQKIDRVFSDTDSSGATSATNIETNFVSMFHKIGAAAIAAKVGTTLKGWAEESIQAASDLQEVQNVVDVTFGESSDTINDWAKNASKQYGLTELQAKRYSSSMGAMLKSSGLAGDGITDMSMAMAGLAADMASFYNIDFDDSFTKIMAGLSGETEPLKRYGINMSVKNLEEFAKSKGIDTAFEKMTQAEQVALRYEYLMQATADAQGDFARTSDSYANNVRKLETNLETLKAGAGEVLLPVVNDVVSGINALIESLSGDEVQTAMERLARIGEETTDKKWDLQEKVTQVKSLAKALDEVPESLMGDASSQRVRMGIIDELITLMPELSSIIDTSTGEIEGGTGAVLEFIDAWAQSRGIEINMEDLAQKQGAVAQSTKELEQAYMDYAKARGAYAEATSGIWGDALASGDVEKYLGDNLEAINEMMNAPGATVEDWKFYFGGAASEAQQQMEMAEQEILRLGGSLEEARGELDEMAESFNDTGDAAEDAADSIGLFSTEAQGTVNAALESMAPALKQMADMWEDTRSSIASSVNSTLGDLGSFDFKPPDFGDYPATAGSMIMSLEDQIAYMDEYMDLVEQLKEQGLSGEILSNLSSGSTEDFEYLSALAEAPEKIQQVNEQYELAKQKREEFVNSLTETNLEGDETFAALAEQVQTDMDTLTTALSESGAPAAAEATMQAILDAVTSRSASISQAIDEVVANWAKLEGLGFSGFGTGNGAGSSNGGGTPHAGGLDYVPFNGYMARLHEGESVLTAEQSRAWRSMMDGPGQNSSGLDYSALGGVIRDNTPRSTGNVYLDGKTLGKVISDQQANSYNNLSRSGWSG